MVVSKRCLGAAVRVTAINAYRADRKHQTSVGTYQNRQSIIDDLVRDCKIKTFAVDNFLTSVILGTNEKPPPEQLEKTGA